MARSAHVPQCSSQTNDYRFLLSAPLRRGAARCPTGRNAAYTTQRIIAWLGKLVLPGLALNRRRRDVANRKTLEAEFPRSVVSCDHDAVREDKWFYGLQPTSPDNHLYDWFDRLGHYAKWKLGVLLHLGRGGEKRDYAQANWFEAFGYL